MLTRAHGQCSRFERRPNPWVQATEPTPKTFLSAACINGFPPSFNDLADLPLPSVDTRPQRADTGRLHHTTNRRQTIGCLAHLEDDARLPSFVRSNINSLGHDLFAAPWPSHVVVCAPVRFTRSLGADTAAPLQPPYSAYVLCLTSSVAYLAYPRLIEKCASASDKEAAMYPGGHTE